MDIQLSTFVMVAETSSFTQAAKRLHTTQPAVSQQIAQLEHKMGTKLLERTNKSVRMNQAGQIVYAHAAQILNLYGQMERLVRDMLDAPKGPLSIGASYTFGEYVLPQLIAKFCKTYPEIMPNTSIANTRETVDGVANGQLDIGIIEGHCDDKHVRVEALAEDTVVIICGGNHPFAFAQPAVNSEDLSAQPWIVREQGSGTREVTDLTMASYGIHPATRMEFSSTQAIKGAVEAGLGITILSNWTIQKELTLKTLYIIPFGNSAITRQFSMVTRDSEFATKATSLFQQFLRSKYAKDTFSK